VTGSDHHPWSFPSTEWSAPEIYHATATLSADPPSSVALGVPGRLDVPADSEALWGETTYSGPRRYRPRPGEPEEMAAPPAVDESDQALLSHSKTMAVASLASRITGFLRSVALAAALGVTASRVADSYNIANTLPNMVYELLLGGVLSSVIVPLIVNAQEKDSDRGTAYTQRLLTLAVTALGLATMIAVAAAPLLAWAYGAGHDQRQADQRVRHAAAARDLLLRPRRDVRGHPQHPRSVRSARVGSGAEQPRHHRHRRDLRAAAVAE
jgi:putative peptidoglycan lipid II flippase